MSISKKSKKNFNLLSYSRLLQETVFYYPIFIPFIFDIGLGLTELAYYIAAVNIGVLIFEIPSGILADRWSRKGTLFISTIFHMTSIAVMATSTSAQQIVFGAFLWGIFFAMQSGTHLAIIYDMLKEEKATSKYKKYAAKFNILGTTGLLVGSISGAIMQTSFHLSRPTFIR